MIKNIFIFNEYMLNTVKPNLSKVLQFTLKIKIKTKPKY